MTKAIRIENADTSSHKVLVHTEERNAAGEWVRLPSPVALDYPATMTTAPIWANRRLVVEEVTT